MNSKILQTALVALTAYCAHGQAFAQNALGEALEYFAKPGVMQSFGVDPLIIVNGPIVAEGIKPRPQAVVPNAATAPTQAASPRPKSNWEEIPIDMRQNGKGADFNRTQKVAPKVVKPAVRVGAYVNTPAPAGIPTYDAYYDTYNGGQRQIEGNASGSVPSTRVEMQARASVNNDYAGGMGAGQPGSLTALQAENLRAVTAKNKADVFDGLSRTKPCATVDCGNPNISNAETAAIAADYMEKKARGVPMSPQQEKNGQTAINNGTWNGFRDFGGQLFSWGNRLIPAESPATGKGGSKTPKRPADPPAQFPPIVPPPAGQ